MMRYRGGLVPRRVLEVGGQGMEYGVQSYNIYQTNLSTDNIQEKMKLTVTHFPTFHQTYTDIMLLPSSSTTHGQTKEERGPTKDRLLQRY